MPLCLDALLEGIVVRAVVGDPAALEVTGVTHDSRAVRPGSLFCCVPGAEVDGHEFACQAVDAGAVAVLAERRVDTPVVQVLVDSVRRAMGPVAAAFHGEPSRSMAVVGVTGTNGKTTTTHLVHSVLEAGGRPTGLIGTLTGARTTPEAPDLQATLAAMRDGGRSAVAMEVSSHALAQHRVDGTWFAVAVFTNLTRDHLDFHRTMDDYFDAKARLFDPAFTAQGVVDVDDEYGRVLRERSGVPTVPYSLADAEALELRAAESRFLWRGVPVRLPLGGRFNVRNALAAATAAETLGVDAETVALGLSGAAAVRGRFELVDEGQPFAVLVDYAHTPDALGQVLRAAREVAGGSVFVVFGAGGDRDRSKRPEMGAAAADLADRVWLTSDNPRSEDPAAILADVASGATGAAMVEIEPDRRAAIAAAVDAAGPGDVVVIAGKGHETTQTTGDAVVPFDDREVAAAALRDRATAGGVVVVALLIAAGTGLMVSLVASRALIDFMHRHRFGQPIREEGPKAHARKAGTPTMGGLAIVAGGIVGYLVSHVRAGVFFTRSGLLLMVAIAGAGAVGFVDDWIKVTSERNLGLTKTTKTVGLLAVATVFSVLLVEHTPVHLTLSFTRFSSPDITVSRAVWIVFSIALIYATTNAVNLTDGVDGLAAGSASYAFVTYIVIAFWAFRHPGVYALPHALDLAVVAAAMLGACTGFLWWNAAPARIIMGDTGALAIGAAISGLALTTSTPLLLPIVGGLYVMETLSVVIQVGYFRTTGKRVFRMAPIHHHFEIGGWPETTVLIRFWILAGLCTGLALGFYYADFVRLGVID